MSTFTNVSKTAGPFRPNSFLIPLSQQVL